MKRGVEGDTGGFSLKICSLGQHSYARTLQKRSASRAAFESLPQYVAHGEDRRPVNARQYLIHRFLGGLGTLRAYFACLYGGCIHAGSHSVVAGLVGGGRVAGSKPFEFVDGGHGESV